jgi:hypothetical protein
MAKVASSSTLVSVSIAVGLATLCSTFFVKLYRARMLLIERRRRGLVSSCNLLHNKTIKLTNAS